MKAARPLVILVLVAVALTAVAGLIRATRPSATAPAAHTAEINSPVEAAAGDSLSRAHLARSFGKLPLLFVENQGQWAEQVAFAVQGSDKTLYFTNQGVTFALTGPNEAREEPERQPCFDSPELLQRETSEPAGVQRWAVRLDFVGANLGVRPVGQSPDEAVISYFKGRPDEWHAGLPTYRRLVYEELWPGIDLVYEGTVNRLKYHFVVRPGADPNQIRLAYRGATDVSVNAAGQLVVTTPLGGFQDDAPVAYQAVDGAHVPVDIAYALEPAGEGSQPYHFDLGAYDPSRPLILDPAVLVYAGYIGGSGWDISRRIAVDGTGNAYIVGSTDSDEATFPVTVGPDLRYNGSSSDAFVAKVNAAGTALIYAGYIGGSQVDYGGGIAVDSAGYAYVTGGTDSSEATFPVTVGPDLTYNGNGDAFVAKIDPAGTNLVFAGYIGGDDGDGGVGIEVDGSGNVYVAGRTFSDQATFPVMVGPDLSHNGGLDVFVARLDPAGTSLIYAGYFGGNDFDGSMGMALDSSGSVYVTGFTCSSEATFPVTLGPDLNLDGFEDAFVAKVNSAGTALDYAGYIGGNSDERGYDIAVDGAGSAYVTGYTHSDETSFPVAVGPDLTFNGIRDTFVVKVDPAGVALNYAGYIGGANYEHGNGIAVDASGNVYVAGTTGSDETTFPVAGGPDLTYNGGGDTFVAKVNAAGSGLVYAGYIGGSEGDYAEGIAVDTAGNAYVLGTTSSSEATFPVTVGPDLTYNGGDSDAFVAKVEYSVVALAAAFTAAPLTGTAPLTVTFTNLSTGDYDTCAWEFGDGGVSQVCTHPSHSYAGSGSFTVTLTVTGLGGTDTLTRSNYVTVYEPVQASFTAAPLTGTAPLTVTFANLSTGDFDTCDWDFGDGGSSPDCNDPSHTYTGSGTYTVTLQLSGLGGTDTLTRTGYITVYQPVQAAFSAAPLTGTAPLTVTFANLSTGDFDTCAWDFGDGGTSPDCNDPSHIYTGPGTYTATLQVLGLGGTNSLTRTGYITVYEPVQAAFTAAPLTGTAPLTVTFTNLSTGDFDTCVWDFGDGGTSQVCLDLPHTYAGSGIFTVTLTVTGQGGTDTLTRSDYITVYQPVQAAFTAAPTSGTPPLAVTFTNQSTGDFTACQWDLGDGTTSDDCDLSSHTYTAPGVYTVTLTVTGPGGTDTVTRPNSITVGYFTVYLPVIWKP